MNFDKLLKPYKEGGTNTNPVERTMGTIVDYLLYKKQYSIDVVGGAVFMVFKWLDSGGRFNGDGTYGSKGRELVTSIRMKCDELSRHKVEAEVYRAFLQLYADELRVLIVPNWRRRFTNWWHGRDMFV